MKLTVSIPDDLWDDVERINPYAKRSHVVQAALWDYVAKHEAEMLALELVRAHG